MNQLKTLAGEASEPQSLQGSATTIRAWAIVVLLAIIFAVAMIDRVILSMMITPIKADLQLSDTAFGLAQGAAVALFYILFAFPFGWASDRYDRRAVMFFGMTVWSLASAACAFVRNFAELFAARCLIGAGEAVLGPAGYPMIASLVSRQRLALAMMIFYLGGTCGNALGQFVGGSLLTALSRNDTVDVWLIGELSPWRTVFLLTGLPGVALAALIFLAPRERRPALVSAPTAKVDVRSFRAFFSRHKRFYLTHNIGIGLQQAALVGAILWNAAFMARTYHWSASQIGLTFGTILLTTSALAVVGHSWITTRLFIAGRKDIHLRWQLAMSCLCLPALALAYLWPSPLAACFGFGLANLFAGGAIVVGPTVLQIATPHAFRGRASAIYVVIATLLGTAVGPTAIGFVTDHVLRDEQRVGVAMAASCIVFCLGAAIAFALGLAATRRIVAESTAAD
ncbi:MAG TPA: MFS transporter [Steroidobacter sp.]|uniref:MFS transporter n=1 Tax=Steroidobacter sp. TaxID=1978227 RepID=UPI002EDAAB10